MGTLGSAFTKAIALLLSPTAELIEIVMRTLYVSGGALLLAALFGLPLGAALALKRFPLRGALSALFNALMGLPPVVVGLILYVFLSRSGPLGFMGLLYTPGAMVIAQFILALPLVAAISASAIKAVDPSINLAAKSLGATAGQATIAVIKEARFGILSATMAAFGRVMAEVGAVLIVGGNIAGRGGTVSITAGTVDGTVIDSDATIESSDSLGAIIGSIIQLTAQGAIGSEGPVYTNNTDLDTDAVTVTAPGDVNIEETDGTITPEDAVAYAAALLQEHLKIFFEFSSMPEIAGGEEPSVGQDLVQLRELLARPIDECNLSVRSVNS
ncbi:hypothetical protein LCGC14_2805140, partial [marine sediment metagenome]